MKLLPLITISILQYLVKSSETKGRITCQDYDAIKDALITNPVYCGYNSQDLDLSRIVAAYDIDSKDCGTCIKIQYQGVTVYSLVVDKKMSPGLDLNKNQFKALFKVDSGNFFSEWEYVDSSYCKDIYTAKDRKSLNHNRMAEIRDDEYVKVPNYADDSY